MGIDTHNRTQRNYYIYGNAAKSGGELQVVVIHIEITHRSRGYIEDNLTIGDKLLGHLDTGKMRIDCYVGSAITIYYPLIESSQ
jgi:hypothetical protein